VLRVGGGGTGGGFTAWRDVVMDHGRRAGLLLLLLHCAWRPRASWTDFCTYLIGVYPCSGCVGDFDMKIWVSVSVHRRLRRIMKRVKAVVRALTWNSSVCDKSRR